MHYVYILKLENGMLYKGSTQNVKRRIAEHERGKVRSTRGRNPKLVHVECYLLRTDAERREKFLKTTEGIRLLKQQIRDVLKN